MATYIVISRPATPAPPTDTFNFNLSQAATAATGAANTSTTASTANSRRRLSLANAQQQTLIDQRRASEVLIASLSQQLAALHFGFAAAAAASSVPNTRCPSPAPRSAALRRPSAKPAATQGRLSVTSAATHGRLSVKSAAATSRFHGPLSTKSAAATPRSQSPLPVKSVAPSSRARKSVTVTARGARSSVVLSTTPISGAPTSTPKSSLTSTPKSSLTSTPKSSPIAVPKSSSIVSPRDTLAQRFNLATTSQIADFVHSQTRHRLAEGAAGVRVLESVSDAYASYVRPTRSSDEKLVFHGTTPEICQLIVDTGFHASLDGILGPGCYFAQSPELALQYSRYKQANTMLLCMVNAAKAKTMGYTDDTRQYCVDEGRMVPFAILTFEE